MPKRIILATVAVFVLWSVLDFIIHGQLLQSTYHATAHLWRPMEQMNMPLMYIVTLIYAACFVSIYGGMVSDKSLRTGIRFGMLFGLGAGVSMGFGSYTFMPIPLSLAWGWLIGTLIETVAAGAIVGVIVKSR